MTILEISQQQARSLQIISLGLGERSAQVLSMGDLLPVIKQIGILQIDTIHIVARSQYLVLWSRVGNYPRAWLDDLLEKKHLIEYWSHAACLIPVEDLPLYQWKMEKWKQDWGDPDSWLGKNLLFAKNLLEYIEKNGPVKSSDFKRSDGVKGTWWDWKAEKIALEQLFRTGELMVSRREKFQRIYDIAERVHPFQTDRKVFNHPEVREILTARTIKSLGIAVPKWIPDYYRLPKSGLLPIIKKLVEQGSIIPVKITGYDEVSYIHSENLQIFEEVLNSTRIARRTTILSPFDPLVWDRNRLKDLFSVDFRLECYLPAGKRKYGYWLLPLLHREKIIGKIDAKADRKNEVMEIYSIFLEDGVEVDSELIKGLKNSFTEFAEWHKTTRIQVHYCNHKELQNSLTEELK